MTRVCSLADVKLFTARLTIGLGFLVSCNGTCLSKMTLIARNLLPMSNCWLVHWPEGVFCALRDSTSLHSSVTFTWAMLYWAHRHSVSDTLSIQKLVGRRPHSRSELEQHCICTSSHCDTSSMHQCVICSARRPTPMLTWLARVSPSLRLEAVGPLGEFLPRYLLCGQPPACCPMSNWPWAVI